MNLIIEEEILFFYNGVNLHFILEIHVKKERRAVCANYTLSLPASDLIIISPRGIGSVEEAVMHS